MSFYCQSLHFIILTISLISTVEINLCCWIVIVGKYFIIEVLTVPPETAAHTNGMWKKCGSCVHSITTDQTTQTAACNCILSFLNSVFKPLLSHNRLKFMLNKIQIKITFSSESIVCIIRVNVLICPIIIVPYSDNNNLLNFSLYNHIIQCILDFPCCSKSCMAVKKQILTIMHEYNGICFKWVVMIRWRQVNWTFSWVVQTDWSYILSVINIVDVWFKAWICSDIDSLISFKVLIGSHHPYFIIKKHFELNQSIGWTSKHNIPIVRTFSWQLSSIWPCHVTIVTSQK